jgi:hypothetical protein
VGTVEVKEVEEKEGVEMEEETVEAKGVVMVGEGTAEAGMVGEKEGVETVVEKEEGG